MSTASATNVAIPDKLVPRGRGELTKKKNAKKRQEAADKAAREAKILADAKIPEFKLYKPTTVPTQLRLPCPQRPRYLVVKRTNAVPASWNQRLMLWSLVHLAPHIGYVPTDEECDAAKGINLMDFFLRCSVVPLACFENLAEATAYMPQAAEMTDAQNLQVLEFYSENPVPCYANGTDRTYVDEELAVFMKNYNKEHRANYELQRKRILELPAIFQEAGRKVTVTDPVPIAAEDDPARLKALVGPESSDLVIDPNDADVVLGGDPRVESYVREVLSIEGRISQYQKQIEAANKLIDELRDKSKVARDALEEAKAGLSDGSDDDESDDGCDDDKENVDPTPLEVKRLGVMPNGTKYYVSLDNAVVPYPDGAQDCWYKVVAEPAPTPQPEELMEPEKPSKAAEIAFGVGSEAATDRMAEAFALVAEQNARNRLRIKKLLEDEAAEAAAAAASAASGGF